MWRKHCLSGSVLKEASVFFVADALCLSAGRQTTRPPRHDRGHDRGSVPGGNRSAARCLFTVLRRALYHYATIVWS